MSVASGPGFSLFGFGSTSHGLTVCSFLGFMLSVIPLPWHLEGLLALYGGLVFFVKLMSLGFA